jgi:GNAT superfamily N-acetyltransferase
MRQPTPALSPLVPLAPNHHVGAFTCGAVEVDQFLRERAAVEQALRLSQVYVTVDRDDAVCAFFTLSPITVRVDPSLLARLGMGDVPYPAIGGFLLGRLGVDSHLQGRGIGEALVMRAAQIAKHEARFVGGVFLAVDPKDDRLVQWYARQSFVALSSKTRRMILPLQAVP